MPALSTGEPGRIGSYAVIGDCGTAALVSDRCSIDWLCMPRFDSDPVFAQLLDPAGGHCRIQPPEPFTTSRRYLDDTGVLATTLRTPHGRATVYDFFAAEERDSKRRRLWPFRYLVRRVVGEEGRLALHVELAPADAFGGSTPRLRAHGRRLAARVGGAVLLAQCTEPFRVVRDKAVADLEVGAGDIAYLACSFASRDIGSWPPLGGYAEDAFRRTVGFWQQWSRRAKSVGPEPEMVRRSAMVLKLLTFAPAGAVVAAPTTSLPETPGGTRNWDYRYSWVRDASWTVAALDELGYPEQAHAYLFWALNAARLTQPRVRTMYTVYGDTRAPERELAHLQGFEGARPVRVGNGAAEQLQLDNWGHLVDAAYIHRRHERSIDAGTWASLRAFIQYCAEHWRRPDQGIWEERGNPRHYVHSKVMCWVALDRGVRLVREYGHKGPVDAWVTERDRIRDTVLREGVDERRGCLIRAFDDPAPDAALLLVPATGFLPATDDRVLHTIDWIQERLSVDGLVYRYRGDDGLPGSEGAFVACSFWLAHALALAGRVDEARDVFVRTCGRANDVGLLSEEIEPETGRFLGNFPQGLSHIALLNAAVAIDKARDAGSAMGRAWRR